MHARVTIAHRFSFDASGVGGSIGTPASISIGGGP
jgi:hypothetical protein